MLSVRVHETRHISVHWASKPFMLIFITRLTFVSNWPVTWLETCSQRARWQQRQTLWYGEWGCEPTCNVVMSLQQTQLHYIILCTHTNVVIMLLNIITVFTQTTISPPTSTMLFPQLHTATLRTCGRYNATVHTYFLILILRG